MPIYEKPETCAQLLASMIAFDTVNRRSEGITGTEAKMCGYLDQVAARFGLIATALAVKPGDNNLLVTAPEISTAPWVLFDSHMDTVSVDGMTVDPFEAKIENGRIYGRGACDTKGTGAAMLWALRRLVASGESRDVNIGILFNVDEEVSMVGIRTFVDKQLQALEWRPSAVVVGEPTLMQIVSATGGTVRWSIRTRGVSAHSSDPSRGRSAISAMVKVIEAIESRYIPQISSTHPLVGRAACSINLISGGSQVNVIPEDCEVRIDRRLVPGDDAKQVVSDVEKVLNELRIVDRSLEVEQLEPQIDVPLDPAISDELVSRVGRVLASHRLNIEPTGVAYGTNGSKYSAKGIPTIVLGPGSIDQAHTKDEWLALAQLELGEKVYFDLMRRGRELVPASK